MSEEQSTESAKKAFPDEEVLDEYVDLPHGKDLDEDSARELALSRPMKLIVVAGPVSCGKTTLLLSIYELFLAGEMPGWLLAGCFTFHGFEIRCHPSRVASGAERAYTERTLTNREDGVRYLHIRLARESSPDAHLDFLFTDVTGEVYEDARDSTHECKELSFVGRSDHFLLALDGKKIASDKERFSAVEDGKMILRSMLDSAVLDEESYVCVLFTKCDHFTDDPLSKVSAFRGKVADDFRSEFESRLGRLTFTESAARPRSGHGLTFGHGLLNLLEDWATTSRRSRPLRLQRFAGSGERESERFHIRYFEKL